MPPALAVPTCSSWQPLIRGRGGCFARPQLAGAWYLAGSGTNRAGLLGGQLLLGHLVDHVVQDASVTEVSELHVRVEPHHSLEGLPSVQLQRQRGRVS